MKFIKGQLKALQKELSAKRSFKRALWRDLDTAWDARHLPAYAWYQTLRFRYSMAVIAAFMAVATVTTSAYAYSSSEVTDGTPLYPIKQTIEAAEKSLQTTPTAKANFLLKQMKRREAEKKVLEKRQANVQKVDVALSHVASELQDIDEQEIKTSSTTEAQELHKKIQQKLEHRKEKLEKREEHLEKQRDHLQSLIGVSTTDRMNTEQTSNTEEDPEHKSDEKKTERRSQRNRQE